jgi:hypothetical protein
MLADFKLISNFKLHLHLQFTFVSIFSSAYMVVKNAVKQVTLR